jgi:transcriptional regulator with PAS, ATPase and Fis domain
MNATEAKTDIHSDRDAVLKAWQSSGAKTVGVSDSTEDLSLRSFRNVAEIRAIGCALEQTDWNRKRAAKLLDISYRCLLYKIRRHNITPTVQPG